MHRYLLISLFCIIITIPLLAQQLTPIAAVGSNINGIDLRNPTGLAVSPANDEFFITDALNDRIVIFDTLGQFIHSFDLGGDRANPFGIAVDNEGEIFVGSMDAAFVWVYDFSGNYLRTLELSREVRPGRMAIGGDGRLFLIDRLSKVILILDKFGDLLHNIELPEGCRQPSGIILGGDGNLLVISSMGDVVTSITPDGSVKSAFGKHGRRPEEFSFPIAGDLDTENALWIVDSFKHQLIRYDLSGNYISSKGYEGKNPGEFYFPVDMKITKYGKLAVLEKGAGRLQIFELSYEK